MLKSKEASERLVELNNTRSGIGKVLGEILTNHRMVVDSTNGIAESMYFTLLKFVRENSDLYDSSFMYTQCFDFHGIKRIKDRPNKEAFAVTIYRTDGEGSPSYPTYLVPYTLLDNPEQYRQDRLKYLMECEAEDKERLKAHKQAEIEKLQNELIELEG